MKRNGKLNIVWAPQAGPQQALIDCPFPEIFFGGARGGGKTDGVLGKWGIKAAKYGHHFNAVMFRRTTVSSDDAIERAKQIYLPLGARFNESKLVFRMPGGGRVSFRYLDRVGDADEYQGRNLTDAWVEEVGQYPDPAPIERLFGVLRSPHGVPVQLILTGNPGGSGQHWIADRYGLIPFPDRPKVLTRALPNGATHRYAVIPSRIQDNRVLLNSDPEYINRLHLVGGSALVRAWLEGDWSAIEGAFFECWRSEMVLRPFAMPDYWTKFRSLDWGSARPFSVGWWAYTTDDYEHPDGLVIPDKSLIRYREWYGKSAPNKGLKLTVEEVADGILEREKRAPGSSDPYIRNPADPSIFKQDGGPSIAERFLDKGVLWAPADNTRVGRDGHMGGWDHMRHRMKGDYLNRPLIYTFSTCEDSIRTIPVLQHDMDKPEDLDTDSEDHAADEWRYAAMSRQYAANKPIKTEDNTWSMPTAEQIEKRHAR